MQIPSQYNNLRRGLKILELLSEEGALTDRHISLKLKYNLITVQQLLLIYINFGYVTRNNDNLYDLSAKIIQIGIKFRQRCEIKDIAHVHLKRLSEKYNETSVLGAIEKTYLIHVDKIDSMEFLRFAPCTEQKITAHHTALGKSILAYLPVKELNQYCQSASWNVNTPKTINSEKKLLIRLKQIRIQGFSICDQEYCIGSRGIAVPIMNQSNYPRFSIGIWGPVMRMTPNRLREMQIDLTEASKDISHYYKIHHQRWNQNNTINESLFTHKRNHKVTLRKKSVFERALAMFL